MINNARDYSVESEPPKPRRAGDHHRITEGDTVWTLISG